MPNRPAGGRKGQKKGIVAPVFNQRIDDLMAQAGILYKALLAEEQRQWQIPSDFAGDLHKIESLHKPSFEREELNTAYEEIMKSATEPGTTGDVVSVKMQLDYNAGEERAFRHRHATICRCICHAHGRRYGQHHGMALEATRKEAGDIIATGAVGGEQ